MISFSTESFIKKANKIHNFEFDYSLVEYKNSYTKIKIICHNHGIFEQQPASHLRGQKCLKCVNEKQTLNNFSFIEKAKTIHGDKYDYSLVDYKLNKIKIKIICPIHGEFEQKPSNHLFGNGCLMCSNDDRKNTNYIDKCKIKFSNKYDYSLVNYKNNRLKVNIICPTHGNFEQTLKDHLNGDGCPYCSGKKMNTELFIKNSIIKHNNFFDYSLVEYKGCFKKIKIICPIHGIFEQKPSIHLFGSGCPICKASKGEKEIISFLNENRIFFIHQKKFEDCKNINELIFDFFIPYKNLCIEFNGIQHYKIFEYFGGEKAFELNKKRDGIKKEYCKNKKIKFRIVTYKDNIKEKLIKIFNE